MTLPEVGAYIRLIARCWLEGSLPDDLAKLGRLCGTSEARMTQMWPAIVPCFRTRPDGRWIHPRLEKEREKQAKFSRRQTDAADARWAKAQPVPSDATAMPDVSHGNATAMPERCFAVSDLQSSTPVPKKNLYVADEIAEKAGRFLRNYPKIYAEERGGAHFPMKEALYFPKAIEIVTGWPDEGYLEEMLRRFFNLPPTEAMTRPGTPAQFLHLAPEIDARMRKGR